jgi:hypothetical protein
VKLRGRLTDGSGTHTVLMGDVGRGRDNLRVVGPGATSQPSTGAAYVDLASTDGPVGEVLRFLEEQPSWGTLFKIHEVIQHDAGGLSAFASGNQVSKFTNSANNASLGGEGARHARSSGSRPTKGMTLVEGDAFIRDIAASWLAGKFQPS